MKKPKRKYDKIVVLATAIAAILIISGLGFSSTQELSGMGTGLAVFSGFALIAPSVLAVILFAFLVLKIRG
ncbi:MAG: hypothetical protein ISS95_01280 [Candidatus Aenigmarchaeota archaeon]|nr:hypothetical protein [Candidatus Aenigmarchaeota archaeon]